MSTLRIMFATAVLSAASLTFSQIVPKQENPPFFKGGKDKEDESKTRSLSGVVRDEQDNPAEGSIVQLKDTKTLQVRSFIVKEDGTYRFHGLSTDVDYQVKAEKGKTVSGIKTLTVFDSRKAAVINLKLEAKK